MYFLGPDRGLDAALVTSASDLTLASTCEFAFLRVLDVRLGLLRQDEIPPDDAMLVRAGRLGEVHEQRLLERYRAEHGDGVVEVERPDREPPALREAAAGTLEALRAGAPVVYQGVLYDETDPALPFVGYVDFFVRRDDGRYRIVDTKLARRVKVTALLQLAAYHAQLERLGVPVDDTVELILGDDRSETAHIDDVRPVYRHRLARMHAIIAEHRAEGAPVAWGDDRYSADGRCKYCEGPAAAADDLVTVAGMRRTQRDKLRAAGIMTLTELAAAIGRPEGCDLPISTFERLRLQAQLQATASGDPAAPPPYLVTDPRPIVGLPAPSPGDIFFDFEGDPMYAEVQPDGSQRWGLDYLFGWVDVEGRFDARWAHTQAEEATALAEFLEVVRTRLDAHPGMHIYHYAAYERTHLLSIAARHGVGERFVDELLRRGTLIDLYPVVTGALRVGTPSYSIKQLEPLYMGDDLRSGVTNAADSVDEYVAYRAARDAGEIIEAQQILDDIADYNEYDCRSTLRLRDWVRALPEVQSAHHAHEDVDLDRAVFEPSELDLRLQELGREADARGEAPEAAAYRLAAAAIDYHRREQKSFWWDHYARLEQPAEEWEDTRGVLTIGRADGLSGVEILLDWHQKGKQRSPRRHLRLTGQWAPGSGAPRPGGDAFLLYPDPPPFPVLGHRPGHRAARPAKLLPEQPDLGVDVVEILPPGTEPWSALPSHLTPGPPPRADSLVAAIEEWGARLVAAAPGWPDDAMTQLLLRRTGARPLERMRGPDDAARAVTESLLAMDAGWLAVQGPPGTGKTYLAAQVVRRLIEDHHWAIGVTAQSHKVIENVLDGIVLDGGVDPGLVGKKRDPDGGSGNFTEIPDRAFLDFAEERAETGYVIGGTAWDLTNRGRVAAGQLDLLVIDEAGQFSLAATIATALSARRILLLGDPQQLPQVSQGIHPAPVEGSALGHVIGQAAVLPEAYGYFLAESRRMDAAVTRPVSRLAYDGRLHSHPTTVGRGLAGVEPGLHAVPVPHVGNATASVEEAAAVVDLVRTHLGRAWTPTPGAAPEPLGQDDVIVVTPYNAQVEQLRAALEAAGLGKVPVGTVDKFQGREAVIAIVSLAASDATEVPRGLDFLLDRNRLNVSISRAKWAAYLVHSPALLDYLPGTPDGVATLSRFFTLVESGPEPEAGALPG
ncbi:MAG TPA: TM0106 family RecB-like putative nuclease [Microbacteriaceae bacterium]|nr:TM0106 family RecB-like putative nuclease [Microbacteriaceae bacterium]